MSILVNNSSPVRLRLHEHDVIPQPIKIKPPAAKSLSNRALILAAQADGQTQLENLSQADDTQVLQQALRSMQNHAGSRVSLNLAGSGSALRFLTCLCAIRPGEYLIDGNAQLRSRPIEALLRSLQSLGADITPLGQNQALPLLVRGKSLQGRKIEIQGDQTSQFVSALLLTAPSFLGGLEVSLDRSRQVSFSYIELTLAMMTMFGVRFTTQTRAGRFIITIPEQKITAPASSIQIEADAASASYFAAASYILDRPVLLAGINLESVQPEIGFFKLLAGHGFPLEQHSEGILVHGHKTLPSINCSMNDCSDTAMTMGILACFFEGESFIHGIGHNRWKESNRIEAFTEELESLGYKARAAEDGFNITGTRRAKPETHLCKTHEDHRMVMALSLLALREPRIAIEGPQAVLKSYPNFFSDLEKLGLRVESIV